MQEIVDSLHFHLKAQKKRFLFGGDNVPSGNTSQDEKKALPKAPQTAVPKIILPKTPVQQTIQIESPTPKKATTHTKAHTPSIELEPMQEKGSRTCDTKVLESLGIPVIPTAKDTIAKKVRFAYKDKKHIPEIPILHFGSVHAKFLHNLAHAIGTKFGSSRVLNCSAIEEKEKWDVLKEARDVKLFILPDFVLAKYPMLQEGFLENGTSRLLFGKPLLLLPDLSLYMKDPELKRSLWNILCTLLQK